MTHVAHSGYSGQIMTNRLRVLRAERDVTQREVVKASGVSTYRYWAIENGHELPTEDELKRLVKYFKKPASELFPEQSAVA